ncbi:hypothetical protein [Dongshaea marina]|uniref:hypothetical protein n=1 Tax=Dongshaea marina TaxID=2047966 RepID=UPI000D3E6D0D|nr:hypothetical protein [Dongshaea marina]
MPQSAYLRLIRSANANCCSLTAEASRRFKEQYGKSTEQIISGAKPVSYEAEGSFILMVDVESDCAVAPQGSAREIGSLIMEHFETNP